MKNLFFLFIFLPVLLFSQQTDYKIEVEGGTFKKVSEEKPVSQLEPELIAEALNLIDILERYQVQINRISNRLDTLQQYFASYTDTTLTEIREGRVVKGEYRLTLSDGAQYSLLLVKQNGNLYLGNTGQTIVGQVQVENNALVTVAWTKPNRLNGTKTVFRRMPDTPDWVGVYDGRKVYLRKQ